MAIHFFTDKSSWEGQNQSDQKAFGVIDQNSYRLQSSHKFVASNQNLAIAVSRSLILIQKDAVNPDLINIALKPIDSIDWEYEGIAYFVYRGIKKDSIIIPNPDSNTNTDFPEILTSSLIPGNPPDLKTAVIENKQRLNEDIQDPNILDEPAIPRHLGYSYSASASIDSDDYSPDNQRLEKVFFKETNGNTFQLPIVESGAIIGEFNSNNLSGFEIIGDLIGSEATMGILRGADEHILNISGLSSLEKKLKREQILNYFDPAAFYGNYIRKDSIIYGFTASNNQFIENLNGLEILQHFINKNKLYIDIRHQTGFSYNFYDTFFYDNVVPVNPLTNTGRYHHVLGGFDSNPTNKGFPLYYSTSKWPIFSIDGTTSGLPENEIPYYLSFLNLVGSLAAVYPTFNIATPYNSLNGVEYKNRSKGHVLERTILVYGKSLHDIDDDSYIENNFEGNNFLKSMYLLNYDDYITAGEDPTYIGKVKFDNATVKIIFKNTDSGFISSYYNIKILFDFKASHHFAGLIPRRIINPILPVTDSNLKKSLLRHDDHILDLMFPIFEMKQTFEHEAGRVSVKLYSSENAFITSGTYGYYYDQRYLPKIGIAEDDNNLTFFTYVNDKNIFESANISNERKIANLTSFTIPQQADFLFGLTKRDLNVTLQKHEMGTINYKDLIRDSDGNIISYDSVTTNPDLLFYIENNSVNDGVDFELDYEKFDCITITKDQFNQLKTIKDTQFGTNNLYRVYLGVKFDSIKDKKSKNSIIGRYRLMLKGIVENSGELKEKHILTNIFIYTKIVDYRKEKLDNYKTY